MVTTKGEADDVKDGMEDINEIMTMRNGNSNMETIGGQDRGNS